MPNRTRSTARLIVSLSLGLSLMGAIVYSNFAQDGGVVPKAGPESEQELRENIAVAARITS